MGQGIRSTLAAAVADELGADWARVRIVQADGDEPAYGSQNTDGSHSVTDFLTPLRQMGATARLMLEAAAAPSGASPPADVRTETHEVDPRRQRPAARLRRARRRRPRSAGAAEGDG